MTEIDVYRPRELAVLPPPSAAITERDVVDGWVQVVTKVAKLADMIADTEFVPKALRNKPAAITACMLTGREIGVGPMLSMKVIHMVNGTPSLAAEYKRGRALQAGHEIVYDETSITRCVVRGRRKNEDSWVTVTWTIEDARRAKLAGKDVWQQNPRRMLEARATGELCDLKFPDCSWGLATTEALQDGDTAEFADKPAAEQPAIESPKPAQRTARRRQAATQTASPAAPQTPAADAPSSPVPAAGEAPQPPLPGEEDVSGPAVPDGTPGSGPAAGPETPNDTDYDSPGTVTPGPRGQLTKIGALFTGLGFTKDERDQRLVVASEIIGRDIGSSSDLSRNEAKVLIDTLARCDGSREKLIALLAAGEAPEGSDG